MEFFNTVPVEQAIAVISEKDIISLDTEILDAGNIYGRVLAESCASNIDVPEFSRSTVDGYAVICEETQGSGESIPTLLKMLGEAEMGKETKLELTPGTCVYVPTGGMLPSGATGVVMIEYCERMQDMVAVHKGIRNGENIVFASDDIKKNQIVLEKNTVITYREIGLLNAAGITKAEVYKKPKIAIISTGDELVPSGEGLSFGCVYDINTHTISALCKDYGCEVVSASIVKDDFDSLLKNIKDTIEKCDMLLISGGSSAGEKDYTYDAIIKAGGEVFVKGVSVKPGKPTIVAKIGNKPVFGLPGHPVSAIMIFREIVAQFMKEKWGIGKDEFKITAVITENVHADPGKKTFQTVSLEEKDGELFAAPVYGKSGHISLLTRADGYITIERHTEGLNKGEIVRIRML